MSYIKVKITEPRVEEVRMEADFSGKIYVVVYSSSFDGGQQDATG